jgi:hypothetical protein
MYKLIVTEWEAKSIKKKTKIIKILRLASMNTFYKIVLWFKRLRPKLCNEINLDVYLF